MDDLIWAGIRAMVISHALKIALSIGVLLTWIGWGIITVKWAAPMYNKIKRECNIEKLLDTPMKEKETKKMEGNTTYCYPQDEGPLTRICPYCGALYPSYKVICENDERELQPFKKPVTEPLPTIAKLNTLIQDINEVEQQFESELEMIRTALEEKAYEYNHYRPYTFTEQETLSLYNLYNKVHQEQRAS